MAVGKSAEVRKTDARKRTPTAEELLHFYREMLLIRRLEEKAGQMYGMGLIGGFCHLYIGQEAVVVGMQMALKQGDGIITGYRDHGHMLAAGMDAKGVMAELTGRRGERLRQEGLTRTRNPLEEEVAAAASALSMVIPATAAR